MKNKKINAVVLLSGGLDSSTIAYLAKSKNRNIYALTIDYGQRHEIELVSAKKIAKKVNAIDHQILQIDLTAWGGSALTDKKLKVKSNQKITQKKKVNKKDIPNTYVPARNTIFLAFALAYAEAVKAQEIYIGVNSVDYSGYVDCRPRFIKKFQELADSATVEGVYGKGVKIITPLINLSKKDIIKLGIKNGVDYGLTWSCYKGMKTSCGECDSCLLRLKGFKDSGYKDPLRYKV